jgi:hypothetical protein
MLSPKGGGPFGGEVLLTYTPMGLYTMPCTLTRGATLQLSQHRIVSYRP